MGIRSRANARSVRSLLARRESQTKQLRRGRHWPTTTRLGFESLEDRRVLAAISWDGGAGTLNWSDAANWTGDTLPGPSDDVSINVAGDVTIQHAGLTTQIRSLSNFESMSIAAGSSLTLAANSTMHGAFNNSGTVDVQAGTLKLLRGGVHTGDFSGQSGASIEFSGNHTLAVGSDIAGNMDVAFSAGVSTYEGSLNTTGIVTVSFFGSSPVGADTQLNIAGSITAGTVHVRDALAVVQGPIVTNVMEVLGSVSGPSDWTINNRLVLAGAFVSGSGQIIVTPGATMSIEFSGLRLHRNLVNNGEATWTSGNLWRMKDATFTNNGSFTVSVSASVISEGGTNLFINNGTLTKQGAGEIAVGVPFHNSGTVEVQAGTLAFNGPYLQTNGQLILGGGEVRTNMPLDIQGGELSGSGRIIGSISNGGTVTPGVNNASTELITVNGDYAQTSTGALRIENGGHSNGFLGTREYDQLDVTGAVNLTGNLEVSLFDNVALALNDEFLVMRNDGTDSVVGSFQNTPITIGPIEFTVIYNGGDGNDVVLRVTRVAVNEQPVANSQTVSVPEDGSVNITLSGSDEETSEANLTFRITSLPMMGTLFYQGHELRTNGSGDIYIDDGLASPATFTGPPTLTYEPNLGCAIGHTDTFSLVVIDRGDPENDPSGDPPKTSEPGVISIQIVPAAGNGQVTVDGAGIVRVNGTANNDNIVITHTASGQFLEVSINGTVVRNDIALSGVSEVRAWGREGNDRIELIDLAINSLLDGGDGDDELIGAAGDDLMFGGEGNDKLTGAAANDFLIGGNGADRIVGSAGHDILVAGDVACHFTEEDLRLIALQWAANRTTDEGFADDVIDEVSEGSDVLTGSSGADWFIISDGDVITDFKVQNKDGDVVTYV